MITFESAARLLNFTRVSEELRTSQSAISRHISELEAKIGRKLFVRGKKGLALTTDGKRLFEAVVSGLDRINTEMNFLSGNPSRKTLTITCSHEISHLYLMPRYAKLQQVIGEEVSLNVLTQEYDLVGLLDSSLYDIALSYRKPDGSASHFQNIVLKERVRPLCAPAQIRQLPKLRAGATINWPSVPLLDLSKPNEGWSVWSDWLIATGLNPEEFTYNRMTNYVYLLEAAAAGKGIVLGWEGLVERYVENGTLVPLQEDYLETENALCATLTDPSSADAILKRCLDFLTSAD